MTKRDRRRNIAAVVWCAAGMLSVGCHGAPTPTQPTQKTSNAPLPPSAPAPAAPQLEDFRVSGASTMPPGASSQFTATAVYDDGSTVDVTAQAQWTSLDEAVVGVASGVVTARASGEADVKATFGILYSARQVIVVPADQFRLRVSVSEDQDSVSIAGVRIDVLSGATAGASVTTDWNGQATIFGVSPDVQLRLTKEGYAPFTESVHVDDNYVQLHVVLTPADGRVALLGAYTLTIEADCATGDLPASARRRMYSAAISNPGLKLLVLLSDADFATAFCPICSETRGDRFWGQPEVAAARFTLNDYEPPMDYRDGEYPNVVERLPGGGLLAIAGHAIVSPSGNGFAGTLDGRIAIYSTLDLVSNGSAPIASCQSSAHRFTLTR